MNELPNELISEIFENLGKHDLRSVMKVSRHLAEVAAPILFKFPCVLDCKLGAAGRQPSVNKCRSFAIALSNVKGGKSKVRNLHLTRPAAILLANPQVPALASIVKQSPATHALDSKNWLSQPYSDAYIAMVLIQLPNLTTLTIEEPGRNATDDHRPELLPELMVAVFEIAANPKLNILKNLTKVTYSASHRGLSFSWAREWDMLVMRTIISIPSLREFCAYKLALPRDAVVWKPGSPGSKIATFAVDACSIDSQCWANLLDGCNALQSLVYCSPEFHDHDPFPFEEFVHAVSKSAAALTVQRLEASTGQYSIDLPDYQHMPKLCNLLVDEDLMHTRSDALTPDEINSWLPLQLASLTVNVVDEFDEESVDTLWDFAALRPAGFSMRVIDPHAEYSGKKKYQSDCISGSKIERETGEDKFGEDVFISTTITRI